RSSPMSSRPASRGLPVPPRSIPNSPPQPIAGRMRSRRRARSVTSASRAGPQAREPKRGPTPGPSPTAKPLCSYRQDRATVTGALSNRARPPAFPLQWPAQGGPFGVLVSAVLALRVHAAPGALVRTPALASGLAVGCFVLLATLSVARIQAYHAGVL